MFKITARPLKGEPFDVDANPEETVLDLKKRIAAAKPEFLADSQKLIYSGQILQDSVAIKDSGMKSGEFVVVMVAKPKPAGGGSSDQASATPGVSSGATPAAATAPSATPVAPAGDVTGGTLPAAPEATIAGIMEMGFSRLEVERCLRAAFNNPDRAVEYLMSGIPDNLQAAADGVPPAASPAVGGVAPAPPAPAPVPAPAPTAGGGLAPAPFPAMGGASPQTSNATGPLAELRNHPRFNELRAVVQQNPQMLNQVLAALASSNPQLLQQITENQEEFVRMLQEPVQMPGAGQRDPVQAMLAAAQAAQQAGAGGGGGGQPPQQPGQAAPAQIQLTQPEREAIERLQSLGFPRNACLEAYLACDRKEEIAANYLFEQMEED